jgi:hypothetical protein
VQDAVASSCGRIKRGRQHPGRGGTGAAHTPPGQRRRARPCRHPGPGVCSPSPAGQQPPSTRAPAPLARQQQRPRLLHQQAPGQGTPTRTALPCLQGETACCKCSAADRGETANGCPGPSSCWLPPVAWWVWVLQVSRPLPGARAATSALSMLPGSSCRACWSAPRRRSTPGALNLQAAAALMAAAADKA